MATIMTNKHWKLGSQENREAKRKSLRSYLYIFPVCIVVFPFIRSDVEACKETYIWLTILCSIAVVFILIRMRRVMTKQEKQEIEVYLDGDDNGVAVFHNYAFVRDFVGNKAQDKVVVPLSDIYDGKWSRHRGELSLKLLTDSGEVGVSEYEEMPEIIDYFLDIIEFNRKEDPDFEELKFKAPRPQTPWYAWLMAVGAVSGIWYFLYIWLMS